MESTEELKKGDDEKKKKPVEIYTFNFGSFEHVHTIDEKEISFDKKKQQSHVAAEGTVVSLTNKMKNPWFTEERQQPPHVTTDSSVMSTSTWFDKKRQHPHIAEGCAIVSIDLENKMEGGFLLGTYTKNGITRKSKFLVIKNDQSKCQKIVKLSRRVDHPLLLSPVIVGMSADKSHIAIGFNFENNTDVNPNIPAFDELNGLLCEHWATNIPSLLNIILQMHTNNVYHTRLADSASYVYGMKKICIVGPMEDGKDKTEDEKVKLRRTDLLDFRFFLWKTLKKNPLLNLESVESESADLHLFYTMFDDHPIDIRTLINHPVFMDYNRKSNYFQDWFDCCFKHRQVPPSEIDRLKTKLGKVLEKSISNDFWKNGWSYYLGDELKKFYKLCSTAYDATNVDDFLRFIRNAKKHCNAINKEKECEVEPKFQSMFPGLLSILHRCCAGLRSEYYTIAHE